LCFRYFKLQSNPLGIDFCFDSIKYNKCFLNCQGYFCQFFPGDAREDFSEDLLQLEQRSSRPTATVGSKSARLHRPNHWWADTMKAQTVLHTRQKFHFNLQVVALPRMGSRWTAWVFVVLRGPRRWTRGSSCSISTVKI